MRLQLFGRPALLHVDAPLKLRRKGLALLALGVERGRPCSRTWLAEMLWGPNGLANLRQELAALRKLPQANTWLQAEDGWVTIALQSDLEDARHAHAQGDRPTIRRQTERGPFLEGFDAIGSELFQHWLDDLSTEIDTWLPADRAPPTVATQLVADVLSVAPPRCATDTNISQWLGLPLWQVVHARSQLLEEGRIDAHGRWLAETPLWPMHLARQVAAQALASGDVHDDLIPAIERCDEPVLATSWWGLRAARGDRASAERALSSAPPSHYPEACARAAELAIRTLDLDRASTLVADLRGHAVASQQPDTLFEVELLNARLCIARGQLDASKSHFDEARRVASAHLRSDALCRVDGLEGQVLAAMGRATPARRCLERAAEGTHAHSRAVALVGLGVLEAQDGNFDAATELHDRALAATRDLGDRDASARVLNNLGASAERVGWLDRAVRCFGDAITLADANHDQALGGTARVNLAEVLRRQGALGASRRLLGEAFDRLADSPNLPPQACQVRADLELSCGRNEEAAAWFERAAIAWRALNRPDAALAEWMAQLALGHPHDALFIAVDALPLPAQRDLAYLELAIRCEDHSRLEALFQAVTTAQTGQIEALRAALSPDTPVATALLAALPTEGPLPAPIVRLLARRDPADAAAAERLAMATQAACMGLLPSQQDAYRRLVLTPHP